MQMTGANACSSTRHHEHGIYGDCVGVIRAPRVRDTRHLPGGRHHGGRQPVRLAGPGWRRHRVRQPGDRRRHLDRSTATPSTPRPPPASTSSPTAAIPLAGEGNILIENNTITGPAQILNGTTNAQLYQLEFDDNTVSEMKSSSSRSPERSGCAPAIPGQNITVERQHRQRDRGLDRKPADWNIYGEIGGFVADNTSPMCL